MFLRKRHHHLASGLCTRISVGTSVRVSDGETFKKSFSMSWWFHLLIRRVDSLRGRCETMERVMRAVGVVPYAASQCSRLLIRYWSEGVCVTSRTVRRIRHSHGDFPTVRYVTGSCEWVKNGIRCRAGGKPVAVWLRGGTCEWYGRGVTYSVPHSKYVTYSVPHSKYNDEQIKWLS